MTTELDPDEFTVPEVVIKGDLGSGSMTLRPPRGSGIKPRRRAPGEAAGTRKEHDAYDTDLAVARACVEWLTRVYRDYTDPALGPRYILDPTSGMGPFVKAARVMFPNANVAAVDIRPDCGSECLSAGASFVCADAHTIPAKSIALANLIITNPPFKIADALARHFYENMHSGAVLALLLNVTFIGSSARWADGADPDFPEVGLFKAAPLTYMVPIQPRPQFLDVNSEGKKASSPLECALFVWVKPDGTETETGRTYFGATIPPEPIRWRK